MREQRVILEDKTDLALVRGEPRHVAVADEDPAGARPQQARKDTQQRRLARAAGAEKRDELTSGYLERHAVERGEIAEAMRYRLRPHPHCPAASRIAVQGHRLPRATRVGS